MSKHPPSNPASPDTLETGVSEEVHPVVFDAHGLSSKWLYLSRTTPGLSSHFQQLENMIRSDFIPTLTGNPAPDDLNQELFDLPTRERAWS